MTIKPIDLQTNMAHVNEVARNQQEKTEAIVEQQHIRKEESDEKSAQARNRLEENKKLDQSKIRLDEHSQRKNKGSDRKNKGATGEVEADNTSHVEIVENRNLGNFIDIKK